MKKLYFKSKVVSILISRKLDQMQIPIDRITIANVKWFYINMLKTSAAKRIGVFYIKLVITTAGAALAFWDVL